MGMDIEVQQTEGLNIFQTKGPGGRREAGARREKRYDARTYAPFPSSGPGEE
jgi:hypothetical protein